MDRDRALQDFNGHARNDTPKTYPVYLKLTQGREAPGIKGLVSSKEIRLSETKWQGVGKSEKCAPMRIENLH